MIYWLSKMFGSPLPALESIGPRILLSGATAFLLSVICGRRIIGWLRTGNVLERTDKTPIEDPELRVRIESKSGTPTMGGLIILAGMLGGCFLWSDLRNAYVALTIFCALSLAALGAVDDWLKLRAPGKNRRGVPVRFKLLVQALVGCLAGIVLWQSFRGSGRDGLSIVLPFVRGAQLYIGALFIGWTAVLVMVMSNSTNVTDGLDGLAGGLAFLSVLPLGLLAWVVGQSQTSSLLHLPHVAGCGELAVFCAALGGALLGFLCYNAHPAEVFMGDTGSLAIGGALGLVAVIAKMELLLPFICFAFLLEFGSSLLQIFSFKLTGRRILPCAPLHHSFQKMGWAEPKIVSLFYVVGALFAVIGPVLLGL